MGTFAGHALPGSFFIIFGVWALYHALKSFYAQRAHELRHSGEGGPVYINRVSYPVRGCKSGCCSRDKLCPLDSYMKTAACLIGIAGEVFTGFNKDWHFVFMVNAQHATMYSMFGVSGIVELLIFYRVFKVPITPVDTYVHMLLAGVIIVQIASNIVELFCPDKPVFALIRIWGYLVQGTWFWHVGAILYPAASFMPIWDEYLKESAVGVCNLFCYHLLIDFAAIIVFAIPMSLRLGRMDASKANSRMEFMGRISRPSEEVQPSTVREEAHVIEESEETEMWNAKQHIVPLEIAE
ncbi:unnamed protein product [Calicophoron daubneyi]|uniref:Transmembrane protein 45B n=1 Tax=Calicophoron daubneyi TaxID=300641 RepID=A0AAV2U210_CALDB